MLKGFREFVFRGNVFELAVAVVVGTAFTAVVTSVVTNLINPIVAAIGGHSVDGLAVTLVPGNPRTVMHFDSVITAVINFVIIAAVVYFVFIVPMNAFLDRLKRRQPQAAVEPTEKELLTEIRDLLRVQQRN
jgi:large conductance mechanosensitive channel